MKRLSEDDAEYFARVIPAIVTACLCVILVEIGSRDSVAQGHTDSKAVGGGNLSRSIVRMRFIGNEAFELTDGRTTLITDYPYRSGELGYMTYDSSSVVPTGKVVLLISHSHLDHFDPTMLQNSSWIVAGPRSVTKSIPRMRTIGVDSVITLDNLKIHPFRTRHGDSDHFSYRVEWGGRRFFLCGDTDDPTELLRQSGLDYAFVTPWLFQQMSKLDRPIPSLHVVIYHHRTGESLNGYDNCWIPKQGEEAVLE